MVEYMDWYNHDATTHLKRCQSCGALLIEGDMELHTKWHKTLTLLGASREIPIFDCPREDKHDSHFWGLVDYVPVEYLSNYFCTGNAR